MNIYNADILFAGCGDQNAIITWCNTVMQTELSGIIWYMRLMEAGIFLAFFGMVLIDLLHRRTEKRLKTKIAEIEAKKAQSSSVN